MIHKVFLFIKKNIKLIKKHLQYLCSYKYIYESL